MPESDEKNTRAPQNAPPDACAEAKEQDRPPLDRTTPPDEIGGQAGPEPTRYGDWERNGRCTDF